MLVGSNLFVPKKPIKHKVRINSNLQKPFCNYASVLTNKMQGNIGVESELDKGSCFWFELPIASGLEKIVYLRAAK